MKLDLKKYIRLNGGKEELFIDKEPWQGLNVKYRELSDQLKDADESKEKELKEKIKVEKRIIKEAISDAIDGLPLPLIPITRDQAKKDFEKLSKFNSRQLLKKSPLYTKVEYKYGLSNWYISNALVG